MCAQCATTERQAQRPTVGNTERTFFDKSVRSSTVLRKSLGDGKTKKEHYLQNSIKKNPKNQKAKQKKPLLLGVVKKTLSFCLESNPNQIVSTVSWVHHCLWQQNKECQGWAGSSNVPRPWEAMCLSWRLQQETGVLKVCSGYPHLYLLPLCFHPRGSLQN